MADKHTFTMVEIDDGWPHWSMHCPYDPADQGRPCWPNDEDGEPYEAERGTRDGCVYVGWFDNTAPECIRRRKPQEPITFTCEQAEWDDDGFIFYVGEVVR